MRKITTIFLIILFLSSSLPVYASFGFFKPDSKLYFLQPALESLRLALTFSKESKVNYLFELTERRMDEMNVAPSEEIANRYTLHFQQLERITEQIREREREEVAERIKEASLRQQEILAKVYNQVPEEAKEAILNAQENSSKRVEKTIEAIEGIENAEAYAIEAVRIQEIGKSGLIEKLERIQQVPMEGAPQSEPSETVPQKLQPGKELNPEQESKALNPVLNGEEQNGNKQKVQPVQPTPRQSSGERK